MISPPLGRCGCWENEGFKSAQLSSGELPTDLIETQVRAASLRRQLLTPLLRHDCTASSPAFKSFSAPTMCFCVPTAVLHCLSDPAAFA